MKTVIEMAREAGIHVYSEFEVAFERFAELVHSDEREACARMCEQMGIDGYGTLAIAAAIRARSNT